MPFFPCAAADIALAALTIGRLPPGPADDLNPFALPSTPAPAPTPDSGTRLVPADKNGGLAPTPPSKNPILGPGRDANPIDVPGLGGSPPTPTRAPPIDGLASLSSAFDRLDKDACVSDEIIDRRGPRIAESSWDRPLRGDIEPEPELEPVGGTGGGGMRAALAAVGFIKLVMRERVGGRAVTTLVRVLAAVDAVGAASVRALVTPVRVRVAIPGLAEDDDLPLFSAAVEDSAMFTDGSSVELDVVGGGTVGSTLR